MQTEHDKALESAKINLICRPDSVFITTILFSLDFSWDDSMPTASTNGVNLKVNPEFFMSLPKEQRIFLLAHESYHVAFQHMERVNGRNFRIWNMAADYVINLMLVDSGFEFIPIGLLDEKYRGMSSYEVYDLLSKKPEDELPPPPDDMEEIEGTPEEIRDIVDTITETIMTAAIRAKSDGQPGTIPGEVDIFLENLVSPKLPWHTILANLLNDAAQEDYTYQRPNRRYLPDHYLPSLYSEALGEIAVAVDLSGSITQKQSDAFISEIHAIHTNLNPTKTHVIGFDTEISCEHTIEQMGDIIHLKFKGGGGTKIAPVYEWVNTNKPQALIIFTDGYFELNASDIPRNTLVFWIIHSNPNFKVPRGKVIAYKD
jgi:predicted metal-dependent peptidase